MEWEKADNPHGPSATVEDWLHRLGLKRSSVPSLRSAYKEAYAVTSFLLDQQKTLDELD